MNSLIRLGRCVLVAAVFAVPNLALAQTAPGGATGNSPLAECPAPADCGPTLSVRLIPYGWVPAMDGNITVRGKTASVDVTIGDVVDIAFGDLNFAAIGQLELKYGKLGVIFNGYYMEVSPGRTVDNLSFSSELDQAILDLAFTYELAVPKCLPPCSRLEALLGVRYNYLSAGLTVSDSLGATASTDGKEQWLDPFIGARLRVPVCECTTLQVRADIGGFDLDNASKLTWNIEAIAEYRWSERCSLFAGWRWLDIDYDNGSTFGYDMLLHGPLMGFAIDF